MPYPRLGKGLYNTLVKINNIENNEKRDKLLKKICEKIYHVTNFLEYILDDAGISDAIEYIDFTETQWEKEIYPDD